MENLKVGMVGAGSWANHVHYPSITEFGDVNIVAICDLDNVRLTETADKYGVEKRYTDYKEMVEQNHLDAAFIIMPPHQLFDIVIHCLKRGLNVFIEKPPGASLEQTRSMALAAERNGCVTMVGFNRRYIPLMRRAKSIVEGRGSITQCVATYYKNMLGQGLYFDGAVDLLTSDGIHSVDTLRWIGGEAEKVASDVRSCCADYANSFNALIKFRNGCSGLLTTNWAVGKRVHAFEMHAKGVSAFVNPNEKAVIYSDDKEEGLVMTTEEASGSEQFAKYYGYFAEDRHFVDCVREGRQPETNFVDAVKTMELVGAIQRSKM